MSEALHARRILITRPEGQSSTLAALLHAHGATPIEIPTIALAPPASFCALDAALVTLRTYDWLLFTSANAVRALATRARTLNLPPHPRRIAAIGPATARALAEAGIALNADLIPPQAVAESLAEALLPHAAGASMLLVRAAEARDLLPEALAAAGAQVTVAEAYRNVVPPAAARGPRPAFCVRPARRDHLHQRQHRAKPAGAARRRATPSAPRLSPRQHRPHHQPRHARARPGAHS